MDLRRKMPPFFFRGHPGGDQLRVAADRGQGGLQLMAHIGRKFLAEPRHLQHLFVLGTDQPDKRQQLLVGRHILQMVHILGHLLDRADEGAGQASGQPHGDKEGQGGDQKSDRKGIPVYVPDTPGLLGDPDHRPVLHPFGIEKDALVQGLGSSDTCPFSVLQGLPDLRPVLMVI